MEPANNIIEERFLAHIRAAGGEDVARRLAAPDPLDCATDPAQLAAVGPSLTLLAAYARLHRRLSEVLYRRSYAEREPLLARDFADWAVGSLSREAYLSLHLVGVACASGLDIQAMSLVRQVAEFDWRALLLVADPEVARLWWDSLAGAGGKRAQQIAERQLYREVFFPAELMRRVARAEAELDGLSGEAAEEAARATDRVLEHVYYKLLSGSAHGGSDVIYTSIMRGDAEPPLDPLARLGRPSELGVSLLRVALFLEDDFWRRFPRAAFGGTVSPAAEGAEADPSAVELFRAVGAMNRVVSDEYRGWLWSGEALTDEGPARS